MKKLTFIALGLGSIATLLFFSPVTMRTNCGGNNAALFQVHRIANLAGAAPGDRPEAHFSFTHLPIEGRDQLADYAVSDWMEGAKFLVTTEPFSRSKDKRTVIVVCDTPFTNVPQQRIGRAPPAHAVAYSDGTTGLIDVPAFRALDRTKFMDIASLLGLPAN